MSVIKRNRSSTKPDLVKAINQLCALLASQKEDEAIADLSAAASALSSGEDGSDQVREAVDKVIDAFEGDHELMAYTLQREGNEWTEAEELSQASSRVISLARRLKKQLS